MYRINNGPIVLSDLAFDEAIRKPLMEKKLILNSLVEADNNQRLAADKLKMTYDQFRHFYRKYIASNE